ncbi:hypothetical protein ON010_g4562 [Phytophthora cinnamomi]|nr:hypothetical protein ON010_g4562 [Phytophthora cinnamomi]
MSTKPAGHTGATRHSTVRAAQQQVRRVQQSWSGFVARTNAVSTAPQINHRRRSLHTAARAWEAATDKVPGILAPEEWVVVIGAAKTQEAARQHTGHAEWSEVGQGVGLRVSQLPVWLPAFGLFRSGTKRALGRITNELVVTTTYLPGTLSVTLDETWAGLLVAADLALVDSARAQKSGPFGAYRAIRVQPEPPPSSEPSAATERN